MKSTKIPSFEPQVDEIKAVPLYEQVKRYISELILLGTWEANMKLPGENEMARRFGVAVGTVRRALADLTAEGMLSRRPKTGTVVTGRTPNHSLRFYFQYFRLHNTDGKMCNSEAETISVETALPDTAECERLALSPDINNHVIRINRLRRVNGIPVMLDNMVLNAKTLDDFPLSDPPNRIYIYLLEAYGIRITAVREKVTAVIAHELEKKLLELDDTTALLQIDEVSYDQSGRAIIWTVHKALTENFQYVNEVR
jgi:GntR family transcriptional regulator